ncbi:amino acid permease [Neisseriaceae bacterium TC5R-5]|nr:amino acid permease [Neisseriaceae bacterium TC5R-5]
MLSENNHQMRRSLKNRHIQMIALGGAIGTGLFYGSSEAIGASGPSVLLVYALVGLVIFLVMRQMGEMVVDEPVSGSFSYFAYKYWGKFPGFFSGWNYWLSYIIVNMIELTVIGTYINFWFPTMPGWLSALVLFLAITAVNLVQVRLFGEMEFWFSIIKVLTIAAFILSGAFMIYNGSLGPEVAVSNLWAHGGFMPHGVSGMVASLAIVIFAYGGTELIGVTAGEAANPTKSIPRAINQVMWRIMLFYIGALAIVMMISPWNTITGEASPFVQVFAHAGIQSAAHVVNFVVITAVLSAYNSGLYSNARMLYSLAEQNNAPQAFRKLNAKGVPVNGILFSSAMVGGVVFLQYVFPVQTVFNMILNFSVACDTINRVMIIITHMKFRKEKQRLGQQTAFPAPWAAVGDWIALGFMGLIFVIILVFLDWSAYKLPMLLSPLWVAAMYLVFRLKKQDEKAQLAN